MNHQQVAKQIYDDSMQLDRDKGARYWFRKRALMRLDPSDRWIVKEYINKLNLANKPRNHAWNARR